MSNVLQLTIAKFRAFAWNSNWRMIRSSFIKFRQQFKITNIICRTKFRGNRSLDVSCIEPENRPKSWWKWWSDSKTAQVRQNVSHLTTHFWPRWFFFHFLSPKSCSIFFFSQAANHRILIFVWSCRAINVSKMFGFTFWKLPQNESSKINVLNGWNESAKLWYYSPTLGLNWRDASLLRSVAMWLTSILTLLGNLTSWGL